MGVYYIIVNDSKKEYIDPYEFGDNFKLSGIMTGIHGVGVVDLLVHGNRNEKYKTSYWAGDGIRILGDIFEEESEKVTNEYANIGYYVLANIYESHSSYRDRIESELENSLEMQAGLIKANDEFKFVNLNYKLKKLGLIA